MNGSSTPQTKLRWQTNAVHAGRLLGAASDAHYELHLAAIEYELTAPITIETKEDILSRKHWSERLEPYEHQVQNLITFCRRSPVALFADDVGLGKTISAGLVLNELQTRKKVRRALILCPKMLVIQWRDELKEKFGIHAAHGVGKELNPWLQHAVPVVITTYESARDRMNLIRTASFDMIILDEAHKLRNLHGTATAPELAKAIHGSLANRDFKYVLMLTATPIQNRLWDMYSLIDCLSSAKGHVNPLGSTDEFVQRYVADGANTARNLRPATRDEFRRKIQDYMVRTSRREANLAFPERHVQPVQCQAQPAEKSLQQLVGTTIANLNALARMSLAEALMSSPRALLAQVRRMSENGTLSQSILRLFENGVQAAGTGCKLAKLHLILEELRNNSPLKWRALVFTRRLETVDLICEGLRSKGIHCATIRGSGDAANQKSIQAFKADPPQANVIVSTDAGAVGLNLQVCNVIINYDLPWNPMVLEQRIGRVQRLGSTFKHIEVLNLTVKDSVEDHIVARLLSKLQLISSTIGDIEAILEASSFDDDEKFEEELRTLVTRALMGQDVRLAMEQAQKSIEKAKELYDEEKNQVEKTLGNMDEMHRAGPAVPKLKPKEPRFDVPTFCRRAFACDGATLHELPNNQIRVSPRGQAPWTATFDDKDPDYLRSGLGTFGGATIRLYEEGSRPFEGLLGEWRKRHSHRVVDRVDESRKRIRAALQTWANALGINVVVKEWTIRREHLRFNGRLDIRATASVSHDRFEKLCQVGHAHQADGTIPNPPSDSEVVKECAINEMLPEANTLLTRAVETDPDVREFEKFYEARLAEELQRAGGNSARQNEITRRFETKLAADLVGASGSRYVTIELEATFTDSEGMGPLMAALHIVPLTSMVLAEPERKHCDLTKKLVPASWLGECAVSRQKVLRQLLETSVLSKTMALAKHFGTCEITGRRLLNNELGKSGVSGKTVGMDLLRKSEVSGKPALENEMAKCDITGAMALPDELERSGVSGRMVRRDRMTASAKSGIRGHRSEFRNCDKTHTLILPDEGACSDLNGWFVCKDLLMASEKNPTRRGLESEMVQCTQTSRRLLTDEAERSVVSGAWVDKDLAVYSGVSSRPALRDEVLTCAITGLILLPDEAGTSEVSGLIVDSRLLDRSQISNKPALMEELRVCAFTGVRILANEGTESQVSGKYARMDEVVSSVVSKVSGHRSELVQCEVSGDWLLPSESGKSDLSGKTVRPDLLRRSDKTPGRSGIAAEFAICELTGRTLLCDEVATSDVSGKIVDRDRLIVSPASGRRAMETELVSCEETGARFLPNEIEICAITGKRVDRRILVTSVVSGRTALQSQTACCDITKAVALIDELERSGASGKLCRIDQMEASELSGIRAHRSEMVICEISRQRLIPTETSASVLSRRIARTDLLVSSQKNPDRLGFPDEFCICAFSGKKLLLDELIKSDFSGRFVDRDLAVASAVSQRIGLPDEMIACEETSAKILPDESETCSITGKRVNRQMIGTSDLSGKRGLARLLKTCPETRKTAFAEELVTCTASGLQVAPSEVATCAFTGETVLIRLMVVCAISGRRLRRDKARISAKSGRFGHPDSIRICVWTGLQLLADETGPCGITGVILASDLTTAQEAAEPIQHLFQLGIPTTIPTDPIANNIRIALEKARLKVRNLAYERSPHGHSIAYFADCSGLFGILKRHSVGFAAADTDNHLLHPPRSGQFRENSWAPEKNKTKNG